MKRPASVTVFGILNIVFAVFGVCGVIGSAMMSAMPQMQADPSIAAMMKIPAYTTLIKLMIPLGTLSSAVLLAAGIGLLRMKRWGRTLSIIWAIYSIVAGVAGLVFNFLVVFPALTKAAEGAQDPQAVGGMVGGIFGGACGGVLGIAYPIVLLIFMYRSKVRAAFAAGGVGPAIPSEPPTYGA